MSMIQDETGGFPVAATLPGSVADDDASPAPVHLYRVLWEDGRPARNTLRMVEAPAGGVRIDF